MEEAGTDSSAAAEGNAGVTATDRSPAPAAEPPAQSITPSGPKAPRRTWWHPGQSGNAKGRPKGSMNSTTILAMQRARAYADRAVQLLVRQMDDANPYLAQNAARLLLERGLTRDAAESGATDWVGWCTMAELGTLRRIMRRAQKRREAGEPMPSQYAPQPAPSEPAPASESQPDELVIDVTAQAVPE